jgi:hypothetical protein
MLTVTACELPPSMSVMELGVTLMAILGTGVPVPVRFTSCGLLAALSWNDSEALRPPVAAGVKVILTEQTACGARVAPVHVSALVAKSVAFVPPRAAVEMTRLEFPVFVRVTAWGALVVPTI